MIDVPRLDNVQHLDIVEQLEEAALAHGLKMAGADSVSKRKPAKFAANQPFAYGSKVLPRRPRVLL